MKRKVICITDGDEYAYRTIQLLAKEFRGTCIQRSFSNPSVLSGKELVNLILKSKNNPVFVMFDDSGILGAGPGEIGLEIVATHPEIEVLGIIAVASRTHNGEYTKVDVCIDRYGEFTPYGVDKEGVKEHELHRINGDTVYIIDQLNVPLVVGIGDIGKMGGFDDLEKGSPITRMAIQWILDCSHKG